MKKYDAQFAGLALLFAIFASGTAIGMEKELPELEPQFMGNELQNLSFLPPDIRRIIVNKTLRVVLDEAEGNPSILMTPSSEQKSWSQRISSYITPLFLKLHDTTPVFDFIVLLLGNGADIHTKNYKGNTILHLLIKGFVSKLQSWWSNPPQIDFEVWRYVFDLMSKIDFLIQNKLELNAQNHEGDTVAHEWIKVRLSNIVTRMSGYSKQLDIRAHTQYLIDSGLDFTTIKNFNGETACEFGLRKIREDNVLWPSAIGDICGSK